MSQIHSTDAAGLTTLSLFPGLFCIAKKESLAKHLNLHRATLPLFLLASGDHFQWCAYSPYRYECNKRAQTAKTLRLFFCVQLSDVKTL